ncbi:MAG: hypothetical protein ND895_21825 [Pyrinomonadaceae bacterium]|nr:hypothetical protein [Pyrinomonadaceae bacterium]
MPVRKTENRIPANFQPADLGQAVIAEDGRCCLVSFVTDPIVVRRENIYVVFVTDAALAGAAQSFQWTFTELGATPRTKTTSFGEASYVPQSTGYLEVTLQILDAANSEQASLKLKQEVVNRNPLLESIISTSNDEPGPGVGNSDVIRELVNDHVVYYDAVSLQTPEASDGFKRFVTSIVYYGALERTASQRQQHIQTMAESLNNQVGDFSTLVAQGVGVSAIRLSLLAMVFPQGPDGTAPLLEWTELPELSSKRSFADEQLRQKLDALSEEARIDLFNLGRFPKSNISRCAKILETLRDRYFAGTKFDDVLNGLDGTRAERIFQHYRTGPLLRA